MNKNLIKHTVENEVISQRTVDGYVNATALCKASGKQMKHYLENATTKDFISELSFDVGIPTTELIQIIKGGVPYLQGTWVHPLVAINLGQWLSAKFAVQVSKWILEWSEKGLLLDQEYQQFLGEKADVKKNGSAAGKYLADLRWSIYPTLDKKEKYFEEKRQLSLFTDKTMH